MGRLTRNLTARETTNLSSATATREWWTCLAELERGSSRRSLAVLPGTSRGFSWCSEVNRFGRTGGGPDRASLDTYLAMEGVPIPQRRGRKPKARQAGEAV
jgi:hypothetical protein